MLSPTAADHLQRPRNRGPFEEATHIGVAGVPGDGPYTIIHLRVTGGQINRAQYECNGCPSAIASASMLCQIVSGRETDRARTLTAKDLLLLLGGLPDGKAEHAQRAVEAFYAALDGPL